MLARARAWAMRLKRDVIALWIAARSPDTPLAARLLAGCVAAYALSPIDLIPDMIPVLGLLDDLLIVPLGIALALRLVPAPLMARFRAEADQLTRRPVSRGAMVMILLLWAGTAIGLGMWLLR
jgi:uncharacterized membrane protein YkvA (DUF1232 family)